MATWREGQRWREEDGNREGDFAAPRRFVENEGAGATHLAHRRCYLRARVEEGVRSKPNHRGGLTSHTWSSRSCGSARPFLATVTSLFRWSLAAERSRAERSGAEAGRAQENWRNLLWYAVLLARGNSARSLRESSARSTSCDSRLLDARRYLAK